MASPPGKRGPSREASVRVQLYDVADHRDDNPSLKPLLPQALDSAYRKATLEAIAETGLTVATFPGSLSVDGRAGPRWRVLAGVRGAPRAHGRATSAGSTPSSGREELPLLRRHLGDLAHHLKRAFEPVFELLEIARNDDAHVGPHISLVVRGDPFHQGRGIGE
jgi:Domain of unknown function DUF29